ncbi:MAG: 4Fe-4S binding protein [Melioribacteraceae bacterium]|nr:4Fe-4S binding protein [Melioribacteraceae bacterium]
MYLPKIRELKEALTSFFSKPYTTKFPKTPYSAITEFRGKPKYHTDYCVGCGTCAQVCPTNAISITDNLVSRIRQLTVNYTMCMYCGQCEEKCITSLGIQLSNEHSTATMNLSAPENFESIEKEIALCEVSGQFVACRDHLLFIKERLGGKAYAHPNLLLLTQKQFFNLEPSKPKDRIRREDQIKEVHPKIRYKIVVADEF